MNIRALLLLSLLSPMAAAQTEVWLEVRDIDLANRTFAVHADFAADCAGFQFDVSGVTVTGTYGGLAEASDLPNLFVKVSALYAVADTSWDPACPASLAYLQRLVDIFGARRLLFGTDWPPAGRHLTYRQGVEIVRTLADLSDEDRSLILGGTAARLFGI